MVPLTIWVLDSTQLNNIFKKNKIVQARILYVMISLALSYLVVNFMYDFFISSSFV
ncbi:MAG: DUF1146 family protein [Ignavibacteriales bacterium]